MPWPGKSSALWPRAIAAFAEGDYAAAVDFLEPVFPQLTRIGGSHAQREVFEDTLLEAYLRAERFEPAEKMLTTRLSRRESVRDTFRYGRALAGIGQTAAAQAPLTQAAAAWQPTADPDAPELAPLKTMTAARG